MQARVNDGGQLLFGVAQVGLADLDSTTPKIRFRKDDADWEISCDVIVRRFIRLAGSAFCAKRRRRRTS